MEHHSKIRATYKNGVIELLDKIDLPEGQSLEVEIKTLPSATSELSLDQKRELIQKTRGSMKAHGGGLLKKLRLISSQKGNHGIGNFRFSLSRSSNDISVVEC